MTSITYDGSFEGWLTVVFEVFEYKFINVTISRNDKHNPVMFGNSHNTITNETKAARVWKGLAQKVSANALRQLYKTFLSEEKGIELTLLQYVQYVFTSARTIEHNYAHHAVLEVTQTAKKVDREKHRMEAFIRFQLARD